MKQPHNLRRIPEKSNLEDFGFIQAALVINLATNCYIHKSATRLNIQSRVPKSVGPVSNYKQCFENSFTTNVFDQVRV